MRALAIVFVIVTSSALAGPPRATVALLPQARVEGTTVVLGEVAVLRSEDLDLLRKLVHLPLGRAPRAGDVAVLQRDTLAQWIRRETGLGAEQLQWQGAQDTRVLRSAPRLAGEDIARAAVEAARTQLGARGRAAEVQVRLLPRDLDLPAPGVRLEVRGVEQAGARRRLLAWVDVWCGEWFVRSVPVALEVAAGAITAQGERETRQSPLEEAEALPAAGRGEAPVVARGDWATLRTTQGPITLESRAEVLQDGRTGQRVRVRAQGASGPAFARVLGRGQLELVP